MSEDFVYRMVKLLLDEARDEIERLRVELSAARSQAFEEAAKIADTGMLVPPDGGSPTQDEIDVAERIAAAIREKATA
jgi:hypothetical protein